MNLILTASCIICKNEGLEVERTKVANHAREGCWPLGDDKWLYCQSPDCEVTYFNSSGRALRKRDVKTRVTFKEKTSPRPLCYCQQVKEEDVIKVIEGGAKTLEEVKKASGIGGGGQCKITNPAGRCCSRNYRPFIERELAKRGLNGVASITLQP